MAGTAALSLNGSVTGIASGSKVLGPLTITNTASGDAVTTQTLSSGFNTISVPVGGTYTGCVIIPPSGNTVTLTLKGVTGDTGLPSHLTNWQVHSFASGTTAFGITTNGTVVLAFFWF